MHAKYSVEMARAEATNQLRMSLETKRFADTKEQAHVMREDHLEVTWWLYLKCIDNYVCLQLEYL